MGIWEAVLADRIPMETTNKTWWSILHPTCHGWASWEHLCGGGGERLPAWGSGWRYHLWCAKSSHIPGLAGRRAVMPVPAQSIASIAAASCCCSFPAAGRVSGTVGPGAEWAEKGDFGIVGIATVFAYYPLFYRILSRSWLGKLAPFGAPFSPFNWS